MISKTTYWAINIVVSSGFWLGVIPFTWKSKTKRLKLVDSVARVIHLTFATGHIVGRIITMLYFFISVWVRGDLPSWEIIFGMFLMSLLLLTVFFQILILLMGSTIEALINSGFDFQDKIMTFFRVNSEHESRKGRSGLEKIVLIALYAPTILTLVTGPGIYFLLENEVMEILSPFKTLRMIFHNTPGFYGFLTVGAMYAIVYDLKTVLTILFVMVIFINSNSNLLRLHVCPPGGITTRRKRSMQILYRAHEIIHIFASDVTYVLIPIGLLICCLLMMTSFYSSVVLFHIRNYLLTIVLILAGTITCFAWKILSSWATESTPLSKQYIISFQKYDKRLSKMDKLFFKSGRPLVWRVGSIMDLKEDTYPIIMKDVVVNGVMNLLLTFRPGASDR